MSLPVVVIVHGNQEPQSWATITWDNAFSEISRVPFHVVDKVNWSHMVNALNMKFTCQTGRGLTAENLYYLCELNESMETFATAVILVRFITFTIPASLFINSRRKSFPNSRQFRSE